MCQELGCGLHEIHALLEPDATEVRRSVAERELGRIERQFQELRAARDLLTHYADCACTDIVVCRATTMRTVDEWHQSRTTVADPPTTKRTVPARRSGMPVGS